MLNERMNEWKTLFKCQQYFSFKTKLIGDTIAARSVDSDIFYAVIHLQLYS